MRALSPCCIMRSGVCSNSRHRTLALQPEFAGESSSPEVPRHKEPAAAARFGAVRP